MKKEFSKRMTFRNVSIRRRIILSNISMILVPVLLISIAAPVFLPFLDRFMNVDTVTSNQYGVMSQIQWSVMMHDLTAEIAANGVKGNKTLAKNLRSLEKNGTRVLLQTHSEQLYLTQGEQAAGILSRLPQEDAAGSDLFYVDQNGMQIVSYIPHEGETIRMILINPGYQADFTEDTQTASFEKSWNFIAGKMGIIVLAIVGVFVLTISLISILTAKGIMRPLNQLKICTNEITNGNLDYEMEYDSTNEFGMLIKDYDQMRLKLKETMQQRDLLEQQRKEMIAGFSHDLRTPLTAIKGYVEGLIDGIANTPEKEKEYLKTIYTTANDMEHLVSELFLFSKLDVDKVTLEKENIAIVNYLADFCEEEKLELEKSDMELAFSYSCDRMTAVSVDRKKFGRVILNIISNSVKYKKPDQTGHIQIQVSNNERYALIRITDDGIGIDEQSLPHVFETFYRADRARSNVRDGSGLGLSICKKIIDLHEGNIWATGKLGEGTTITIALPLLSSQ